MLIISIQDLITYLHKKSRLTTTFLAWLIFCKLSQNRQKKKKKLYIFHYKKVSFFQLQVMVRNIIAF